MKIGKFCAHQGILNLMPSGCMASFGAAMALGADEIEFDIRITKDGKLVVCHDATIERYADRPGNIADLTLDELREINFGKTMGWVTTVSTPEEIFEMFGGKMVFNIHLKEHGEGMVPSEIARLADKYGCADKVYMAGTGREVPWIKKCAPQIPCVYIQLKSNLDYFYEDFVRYKCEGVQFWHNSWDRELADKIHSNGSFINLFSADTEEDMVYAFENGVDTVLTNRMDIAANLKRKSFKN